MQLPIHVNHILYDHNLYQLFELGNELLIHVFKFQNFLFQNFLSVMGIVHF
eukprot:UN03558